LLFLFEEKTMSTQIATITPRQLHDAQRKGRYSPVLDVRTAAGYRVGHIPGALLVPIEELEPEVVKTQFKRPNLGPHETLYITGQAGPRAGQTAERLIVR